MKPTLVNVIRDARKTYRDSMNKIETIKLVRKLTRRGLKEAVSFWDWMESNGDGLSAPKLAGHWCEEHWQDNEICGCPANAAGADASGGSESLFEDVVSEPIPPQHRAKATAEPRTVKCKCGRADCADKFHAYLMAMIKKHGESEAVQIILEKMDKMTTEQRAKFIEKEEQ